MQDGWERDGTSRPQDVQAVDLEAWVDRQALSDVPVVKTPRDSTTTRPPSPNSELPWLFEQSSRQPPTAMAAAHEFQRGEGTEQLAHSIRAMFADTSPNIFGSVYDGLDRYLCDASCWAIQSNDEAAREPVWRDGLPAGNTSLQSHPGTDDLHFAVLGLPPLRAHPMQLPQLSELGPQQEIWARTGTLQESSSGEVLPEQALPDEAESTPSAARQRRSKRSGGGAPLQGGKAPDQAKCGPHAVPGVIRGASQDFTIDPETGRKLRFGPAMTARMATVELPLVSALFADISAAGPKRQRLWAAAPQPAQRSPATLVGVKKASTGSLPQQVELAMQQLATPPTPRQATARLQSALRSLRGRPPDQVQPATGPHGGGGTASLEAAHALQHELPDAEPMWLDILEGGAGNAAGRPDELTWPLWLPYEAAPALQPTLSWSCGMFPDGMQSPVFGEVLDAEARLFQAAETAVSLQPLHVHPPLPAERQPVPASEQSVVMQHGQGTLPLLAPQPPLPAVLLPEQAPAPTHGHQQHPSAIAPSEQFSQLAGRSSAAPGAARRRLSGRNAAKKQQQQQRTVASSTADQISKPTAQQRRSADTQKSEEATGGKGSISQTQAECKRMRGRRSSASLAALSSQSARTGEASLASRLTGKPPDVVPLPAGSMGWVAQSNEHAAALPGPGQGATAPLGGEPGSRFGGITQSVIQAAARGDGKKAPVFRLEELHRMQAAKHPTLLGVSRSPWSITWDAHVAAAAAGADGTGAVCGANMACLSTGDASKAGQIFLGSYASPATAARAHDIAALRINCNNPATTRASKGPDQAPSLAATAAVRGMCTNSTNYPAVEYEEGLAETRGASIADFIVALQRHGAFDSQRSSRYRGVLKLGEKHWEARFEEPAAESA